MFQRFNINIDLRYSKTVSDTIKYKHIFLNPTLGMDFNNSKRKYITESENEYNSHASNDKDFVPKILIDFGADLFKYRTNCGRFKRFDLDILTDFNYYKYISIMDRFSLGNSGYHSNDIDTSFNNFFNIIDNVSVPTSSYLRVSHRERDNYHFALMQKYSLGLGVGRINNVTYSAMAKHTLDYLSSKSILIKHDEKDLLELAKLYEKLKRERVLDSREARIEQFSTICKWLEETKVSKKLSMSEALNLLDQWEYAFNQTRSVGSRFMAGIRSENDGLIVFNQINDTRWYADSNITDSTIIEMEDLFPLLEESKTDTSYKYKHKYTIDREGIIVEYKLAKPVAMKGQFDFSADVFAGFELIESDSSYRDLNYFGEFNTRLSYKWYPNIRSIFNISTGFGYEKIYWDYGKDRYFNWDIVEIYLNGSINFFVSPKIIASVNGNYSIDKKIKRDDDVRVNELDYNYNLRGQITFKVF